MRNRAEVIKVSIYEYDREFEEKKLRKAEYEAGCQDGIEIGRQDGIEIGRQDGIEIGRRDGIEIGRQAGIKAGEKNILQKLIKKRLSKGMTPEEIADDLDEDVALIRTYMEEHQD